MDWTVETIAAFVLALTQVIKQVLPDAPWRDKAVPLIALFLGILFSASASARYGTDWYVALFQGLEAGLIAIGVWNTADNISGGNIAGRTL